METAPPASKTWHSEFSDSKTAPRTRSYVTGSSERRTPRSQWRQVWYEPRTLIAQDVRAISPNNATQTAAAFRVAEVRVREDDRHDRFGVHVSSVGGRQGSRRSDSRRLLFERIVAMDLETTVCKRKDLPYKATERPSPHWIKVKNSRYGQLEGREELFERP